MYISEFNGVPIKLNILFFIYLSQELRKLSFILRVRTGTGLTLQMPL